jgi:hypothetical protein
MRNKRAFSAAVCVILAVFAGCDTTTNPGKPPVLEDPVTDRSLWRDIYAGLIGRVGTVSSDGSVEGLPDIASAEYICQAIDKAKGTKHAEGLSESERSALATVELLLKKIDGANGDQTHYGEKPVVAAKLPARAKWRYVAYGGDPVNTFVALAESSATAIHSSDGAEWEKTTLPGASYSSVAYGNGTFVSAYSGRAAYSTDGAAWAESATIPEGNWGKLSYGGGDAGRFFATPSGLGATLAYSSDGLAWEEALLPGEAAWKSVVCGDGAFVLASNSDLAAYSSDGTHWSQAQLPFDRGGGLAAWGGGKFAAINLPGDTTDRAAFSTDGATWHPATLPLRAAWKGIVYGNGKFVVISSSAAAWSDDGETWQLASMPDTTAEDAPFWDSVFYGEGKFIATRSSDISKIAYSFNGETWHEMPVAIKSGYIDGWANVFFGDGVIVVLPGSASDTDTVLCVNNLAGPAQVVDTIAVDEAIEKLLL